MKFQPEDANYLQKDMKKCEFWGGNKWWLFPHTARQKWLPIPSWFVSPPIPSPICLIHNSLNPGVVSSLGAKPRSLWSRFCKTVAFRNPTYRTAMPALTFHSIPPNSQSVRPQLCAVNCPLPGHKLRCTKIWLYFLSQNWIPFFNSHFSYWWKLDLNSGCFCLLLLGAHLHSEAKWGREQGELQRSLSGVGGSLVFICLVWDPLRLLFLLPSLGY